MKLDTIYKVLILHIHKKYKQQYGVVINSKKFSYLKEYIENKYNLLKDKKFLYKTKVYWFLNDIKTFPRCCTCGKELKKNVKSIITGYSVLDTKYFHCSTKCAQLDEHTLKKVKETKKRLYGDENFSNPLKRKLTCREKYGVDSVMHVKEFKEKCLNWFNDKDKVKKRTNKTKRTLRKKYGVDNVFQLEWVKNKSKKTKLDLYGDEYYCNQEKIHKKYFYDGRLFPSSPELAYYIWLKDNKIDFEYQPRSKKIKYYDSKGKQHTYYPDFWIKDIDQIQEIKGIQFFKDKDPSKEMVDISDHTKDHIAEAKHQCMIKNNVKIILYDEFIKYISYVCTKYGKRYMEQHRQK